MRTAGILILVLLCGCLEPSRKLESDAEHKRERMAELQRERLRREKEQQEHIERMQRLDEEERINRKVNYFAAHPELSDLVKTNILNGTVSLGMRTNDVEAACGKPDHKNITVYEKFGVHENWIYGRTYLFFENGKITSWHQSGY